MPRWSPLRPADVPTLPTYPLHSLLFRPRPLVGSTSPGCLRGTLSTDFRGRTTFLGCQKDQTPGLEPVGDEGTNFFNLYVFAKSPVRRPIFRGRRTGTKI